MLWVLFAFMCLVAITFVIRPLLRDLTRLTLLTGITVVAMVAVATGVYYMEGSPDVPSGRTEQGASATDIMAMVDGLAARLQQNPDDVNGWKMLGRSYMAIGNYAEAVNAYDRAVELEDAQDATTLVNLGVALAQAGGTQRLAPRAVSVFENAVTLDPNNPEALFWSGFAAVSRGDSLLAADRWERLLESDPPPEIRPQIEAQIAAWRGEAPVAAPQPEANPEQGASLIRASVSVSDSARDALPEDATVFVIARDPAQPSPPIAVTRRRLAELPSVIELDDGDSMIPGRELSAFAEVEVVARVSLSGQPTAQSGDWFGTALVRLASEAEISLAIDEQVQ